MYKKGMDSMERVSILQAAKELGIAPQGIRQQMESGILKIGDVVSNTKGTGKRYWIYREKLDKHMGKGTSIGESQNISNRVFYSSCVFAGILSTIRKEVENGTEDRRPELQYAIERYKQENGVSAAFLEEEMDQYQKVIEERRKQSESRDQSRSDNNR